MLPGCVEKATPTAWLALFLTSSGNTLIMVVIGKGSGTLRHTSERALRTLDHETDLACPLHFVPHRLQYRTLDAH